MSDPSLAIILVNWNGIDHTLKCLGSLGNIDYQNFEIIVVDNGSELEEVEKLRALNKIVLIENSKNLGFTGGNNVGIAYAIEKRFDMVMILNNDTTVEPNFIAPIVQQLENEDVGAVQPKIMSMHHPHLIWSLGGKFNTWKGWPETIEAGKLDNDITEPYCTDWLTGCCIVARREIFEEVGLLDDDFFALCEDVDWSFRAKKKGLRLIIVPTSKIYHYESASTNTILPNAEGKRSPFRQYLHIRNHLYLIRKHPKRTILPFAYTYHIMRFLAFLLFYAIRNRPQKLRKTLIGFRDGLSSFKEVAPSELV